MGGEIRKRGPNPASLGELQAVLRDVMVKGTTREDLEDVWASLLDMAKGQNQWAIQVLFERILGKAAVGATATIADTAVSEEITRRIEGMTDEELRQAAELSVKIHGQQSLPLPDGGAHDGVIVYNPAPWGGAGVREADQVEEPGGPEEPG